MHASLARQNGHAAMLFAMMIPAFFALFILASDGARALQSKARLEDASEVAALAIAARNADADDINKKIATDYISQYMNDMASVPQFEVTKLSCEHIPECVRNVRQGKARFFQYQIHTKTEHFSWFPNDDGVAGFGEKFTVAGSATARKFQSEAVDVMFITDFSGSMGGGWNGKWKAKYQDLQEIIAEVTEELEKYNKLNNGQTNTVGNVSFNEKTLSITPSQPGKYCNVSQLIWEDDGYKYKYEYIDRYINSYRYRGWYWLRWERPYWSSRYDWYPYNRTNVDYAKTVKEIFTVKDTCLSPTNGQFNDIELTEQFSPFNNTMKGFRPGGGTASYEGIIHGAQLLRKGKNARRLLIVLSDGDDNKKYLSSGLVAAGMCSKIQTILNTGTTADKKQIKARLAVIGFDYDVKNNQALADCVGTDNVFKAQNRDDILNKILELISEEIGHLK